MNQLVLNIPVKKVSAWNAETDPKLTHEWLDTLPLADSVESGREIYRALYTLNRMDLKAHVRIELMELYRRPIASVTGSLRAHFRRLELPLSPKKSQLAEFIRQLYMEMAYGYKCALHDQENARKPWGKKGLIIFASERALYYLGQVLLSSYQVYMPYMQGIWKDIHAIFSYASSSGILDEIINPEEEELPTKLTIQQRYKQIMLLGVCNPYQLPQNECYRISVFLEHWVDKAELVDLSEVDNPAGRFLVDLTADAPPTAMPHSAISNPSENVRMLDTIELARTIHDFIKQLGKKAAANKLNLGIECNDEICVDMLRRMVKYWGIPTRRQHKRIKRHGYLSLCTGINATHFFSGGQKPFSPPELPDQTSVPDAVIIPPKLVDDKDNDVDQEEIDLDEIENTPSETQEAKFDTGSSLKIAQEVFRVDRWLIKDESPSGLLLERSSNVGSPIRVGDFVGMRSVEDAIHWRGGVVRWLKSPGADSLEIGIEVISPDTKPVAIKPVNTKVLGSAYMQALLLPAIPALHYPATLIVMRGLYQTGSDIYLVENDAEPRRVRPLKLIERTNYYERLVFANVNRS